MAPFDNNLLKAAEIAERTKEIKDAMAALKKADGEVEIAFAAWKAAATPPERVTTRKAFDVAEGLAAAAREALHLKQKQLNALLDCGSSDASVLGGGFSPASLQYILFGSLAFIFLVCIGWGLWSNTLLTSLSNSATARGLITFLIAIVTVTIALILCLATVVSESRDREKRFQQGKEVLTVLIGVLGTIVGFYFGSAMDTSTKTLEIAKVSLVPDDLKPGAKFTLATTVSGGKGPYTYSISFTPGDIKGVANLKSADGHIKADFEIPNPAKSSEYSFEITVKDSEARAGVANSASDGKKIVLKTEPEAPKKK